METEMKELSDIYDDLYKQGQKVLDTFNPCGVSNGKCASNHMNFCCEGCRYLSDAGCITKSLWCKLWLCFNRRMKHKECSKRLDELNRLAQILGFFFGRVSKKEMMDIMKQQEAETIKKNIDRYNHRVQKCLEKKNDYLE